MVLCFVNPSWFYLGRKTADQTERVGSQKFKKSETRSYEQIKKIQRTDSKKEMLVPKKVTLRASDDDVSDVMEQVRRSSWNLSWVFLYSRNRKLRDG